MKSKRKVYVGGLAVTPLDSVEEAANLILSRQDMPAGFAIAMNAEKVILAYENSGVKDCFHSATLRYADGISVVKTINKKGVANSRIPGCDLWEELMRRLAGKSLSVYLLGASEETNKMAAEKLQREYELTNLVRQNGYDKQDEEIINEIVRIRPNIVTVALGSPKQELLIAKMREAHPDAFYMGVGGSYDVFVGNTKRAPALVQRLGLEWFYRLILQPVRVFRQGALIKYLWLHFTNKL